MTEKCSIAQRIQKLEEGIDFIKSYRGNVETILKSDSTQQDDLGLENLKHYMTIIDSFIPDFATMPSHLRTSVQESVASFRHALDTLLKKVEHIKNETILETQILKKHHKSTDAYLGIEAPITRKKRGKNNA